ncbi:papain fold toxin domain-containing protein [Scytonema hofmannii]|uniref:papain fold toxin domain-containing protein n=1 Tax=Scytonema hofmannii TaxID=34078 RepID=UPI0009D66A66|nr:papain fold toxin domain-containing protein [Scytonema hofmannii]
MKEKNIRGRRIKLDTPRLTKADGYIIDDSLPPGTDAIATNGHHEGVEISVNGEKRVFDNFLRDEFPNGVPTEQWENNLVFDSKINLGTKFKQKGYQF